MKSAFHDSIFDRIVDHYPVSGTYGIPDLQKPEMPENIGHFLVRALKRRVGLEAASLYEINSDWFDSSHEGVQTAFHAFVQSLNSSAHFPPSEWTYALRQAIEIVSDYLVRPVPTLVNLAFGEEAGQTTAVDLLRRVDYFKDYAYLRLAVETVMGRKEEARTTRSEFSMTLSHVDRQITTEYSAEEWTDLLDPLCAMIRLARPDVQGIPIDLARAFFNEKKRTLIAEALERTAEKNDGVIPFTGLQESIALGLRRETESPGTTVAASEMDDTEDGPLPLWKQFTRLSPNAGAETTSEVEPLWKQFQDKKSGTPVTTPTEDPSTPRETGQDLAIPTRPEESTVPQETPAAQEPVTESQADLFSAGPSAAPVLALSEQEGSLPPAHTIGPEAMELESRMLGNAAIMRKQFVQDLFDGSESAYVTVLENLESADSWTSASQIIAAAVFRIYQIDIYSDSAIAFTNAVEERFKQFN